MVEAGTSIFYRKYTLSEVRDKPAQRKAASHQAKALGALQDWHRAGHDPAGGIVVIPTGGGKTFVAIRFACSELLSRGYKVLWLAHTHHLLEQAFYGFVPPSGADAERNGYEIARIAEPKATFAIRVVSGTPGHCLVHTIAGTDDVVVGTLQTIARAYGDKAQKGLKSFLDSAKGKLAIVFDEAHHSPAPSYRKLIEGIRDAYQGTVLIGLTATPTHGDERKAGWLKRLFPQGIITQCSPHQLMADNILAQPIVEEATTNVEPKFTDEEFQKWVGTYRDLPEDIIEKLAMNVERNAVVVEKYVRNREKYGKTIIFADRWYQCVALREMLLKRGVRANVVFSHVGGEPGTVEERNRRSHDDNGRILELFRKGELDVLINVRMLTEGTDVPDVKSVFLTRQTTSRILLTQMVGRALRGPKFGGTKEAHIVSFKDTWKVAINWATYDQLGEGMADESTPEYGKRPPLQLISIDLVGRLARDQDRGILVTDGPFLSMMPVGWYRVQFDAVVEGTEDTESVQQLVLVFDRQKRGFEELIRSLRMSDLEPFSSETAYLEPNRATVEDWIRKHFPEEGADAAKDLAIDLFHVARHMAQAEGEPPVFFPFSDRENHDIDALAKQFSIDDELSAVRIDATLKAEYSRKNRYWSVLYPSYLHFKSQYDGCVNGILQRQGSDPAGGKPTSPAGFESEARPDREPSEEVKEQVKARDGYACLCCGETNRRSLVIDHVAPSYYGGNNSLGNLQTLCKTCNGMKALKELNFHSQQTTRTSPALFKLPETPSGPKLPAVWEMYVKRCLNLLYECRAVESVRIGQRGPSRIEWEVRLFAGNDPEWTKPHLNLLRTRINDIKRKARQEGEILSIRVTAPDTKGVSG